MRELLALTKVHLNSTFGFSNMKYTMFKQKKDLWKPILFIILIASILPAYIVYIVFTNSLYFGLQMVGHTNLMITSAFTTVSIVILIFSIMQAMSIYYFSTDISILVPLPVKPKNIILSRFIGMVVTQYIFALPALIPIMVNFGVNEGKGIIYIIYAIVCVLLVPIVPLSISTIVVMLIMKATNIKGKKDIIRTISMFIMLAIILGAQMFISRSTANIPVGEEQQYIANLLENNMDLINMAGKSFPLNIIVTKALSYEGVFGFINLIINILISFGFIYLTILVGQKVYLGGIIGGEEKNSGVKKLSSEALDTRLKKKSLPSIAVFKQDFRLLLRTPAYVVNCVSTVILIPLIIIVMPLLSGGGSITEITKYYYELSDFVNLGLIAFFIFVGATNPTAATTFSREGKNFWINRLAPVKPIDQIKGRLLTSLLLQLIGVLFILTGMGFLVRLEIATIFIGIVFGLLGSLPIFAIGILIDLIRPVLKWDNPQKAVKQNLNVVLSMLLGIVYAIALGILSFILFNAIGSFILIYCIIAIISILITVTIVMIINNILAERFVGME